MRHHSRKAYMDWNKPGGDVNSALAKYRLELDLLRTIQKWKALFHTLICCYINTVKQLQSSLHKENHTKRFPSQDNKPASWQKSSSALFPSLLGPENFSTYVCIMENKFNKQIYNTLDTKSTHVIVVYSLVTWHRYVQWTTLCFDSMTVKILYETVGADWLSYLKELPRHDR